MTYVEGRFANRRAKSGALAVLAMASLASFGAGVGRNLIVAKPPVSAPVELVQDVPEAVAWVEPAPSGQTEAPRSVRLARAPTVTEADLQAPVELAAEPLTPSISVGDLAIDAAATAPETSSPPPE